MNKKLLLVSLSVTLALSLVGCMNRNAASPSPRSQQIRPYATAPGQKPVIQNPAEVAAHLEALAKSVPQVNGAHCVVMGNTAIVGIDVNEKLDRSRVGTIKYSVAEALRKDPYGKYAIVTADMDLAQRIREIRADIGRGRPISGFAEELADIMGRIVPQMPQDVMPRKDPNAGDHPKLNKSL